MGNSPPPGFRRRQASAFAKALADKLAGQAGVRRRRGMWKMVNYPLNLRPAKNRDAPGDELGFGFPLIYQPIICLL
jgi:hypothetical protein